jgi:PAS domain S-box-containing protein
MKIWKESTRFTLDHLLEGCQILDFNWRYLYINDAADFQNRRPKEKLLGKKYMDMWPGVEETEVFRNIKLCLEERKFIQMENLFVFPDGKTGWFELKIQPVPEGVFILSIDITERKKASLQLGESEKLFRNLFENMLNGFAYCKMIYGDNQLPDFIYVNVNKSFETLTGLKNVTGKKVSEVIPGIQKTDPDLLERYKRVSVTGNPEVFESWVESLKMWFLISVYCPQKGFFVAVFDVISDRKFTEAALIESEERFRSLYENVSIGIYRTTIDGRILMANPAMVRMLGFDSFDQLSKRSLGNEGYEPEYPRSKFLEEIEAKGKIIGLESAWKHKDGRSIYVRESAIAIRDDSGRILYFDGTAEDITEHKLMEKALRESEDKFKYIFDHSVIGKSLTSITGEVQLNDSFCRMLGYTKEELKNLKWQDFTHPDDFEITENLVKSTLEGKSDISRIVKRYIRKDGSVMWADVSTRLRRDNNGNPLYFMTSVSDITEMKFAEEVLRNDEKRLRDIIEALPQLYWTCLIDGPCDYLSPQWINYTGVPASEQLGYGWLELVHPEDRKGVITEWNEKVKTGDNFDFVYRIKMANGQYHWFQARAIPIRNPEGKIQKWLGSNTDIDSIRKAEDQLINYNKDLEQRVVKRTEQLEVANKELESFSYSVSHDLRAPLRAVHGYTKILLEDFSYQLNEEGKRICDIIAESATQMGELIDDLLNFSRIGRTELNPSVINMKKMAGEIFEELTSHDGKKKIKLKFGKMQESYGDIRLINQVWTNLISNAIKYSSKKEVSEISIGSSVSDKMTTYFIKDNGVGFDMQYSHKLFGVFQRLHNETEFEGNGVGLAIVQRIILKHGGKVWAEGEVDKGATFYFSLPVNGVEKIRN